VIALHQRELPRDIATLVKVRGAGLPPLQLQDGANRPAKATLDALYGDAGLFHRKQLADATLAAAVRGLLYLWNGWLDECVECARRAGGAEEHYLCGLVARQLGDAEGAKRAFALLGTHAIFTRLALEAGTLIAESGDAALARFRELLECGQAWDAAGFVHLYEQCRSRALPAATERIVRAIQGRELELLLVHCVEQVLGEPLRPVSSPLDDLAERKARERQRRRARVDADRLAEAEKHLQRNSAGSHGGAGPRGGSLAVVPTSEIRIKCPKCQSTLGVPTSQRGKKTQCGKCGVAFLVPAEKSNGAAAGSPPAGSIGVRCPQCQHLAVLPPGARGKSHTCMQCAADFLVPN